jgi:IS30 family transposase
MGRTYSQLTDDERRKLERWRHTKVSVDVIAEKLGRDRSTIFRELRRNHFQDPSMPEVAGYFWLAAKMKAAAHRARDRKLMRQPELRDRVIERIRAGWTPERAREPIHLAGAQCGSQNAAHHGPSDQAARRPALQGVPIRHVRPRQRVH